MNLIVAVDEKWGIGNKGDLLVRVKGDLKNFAQVTSGKIVILGSNTLATFPGGRVLKNRVNIVMNPDPTYQPEGAIVAHSMDELSQIVKNYSSDDIFAIGGASIYRQLLPYCKKAYITKVEADFEKDAYFTNLDELPNWKMVEKGETLESTPEDTIGVLVDGTHIDSVKYAFTIFENSDVKEF